MLSKAIHPEIDCSLVKLGMIKNIEARDAVVSITSVLPFLEIPLEDTSVDVVLLYDILHRGYFPEAETREQILNEAHRVLKPQGFILVYPTHLKKYGMTFNRIIGEIQDLGFNLEREFYKRLIHDDNVVKGHIFNFRKGKV